MTRLDYYDILPEGMDAYLSLYGHHFSKKMCEWAIGNMRDMNGNKVPMRSKDQIDNLFRSRGIELKNNKGYDAVFSFHMCIAIISAALWLMKCMLSFMSRILSMTRMVTTV